MKAELRFKFLVDKPRNTITVKREFAARRQLVWDCYTKSDLLDRWFAPRSFTTKTRFMDFSEGGHWHYAMVDPDGKEYWGRTDYQTISAIDHYTALDGFCDDAGVLSPEMPRSTWDVTFSDASKRTLVETIIAYKSREELEKVMEMGMQEGLTSTLERLDELLLALGK